MERLQRGLRKLSFEQKDSVCDDQTFKIFLAVCSNSQDDIWERVVVLQQYPTPDLLLKHSSWVKQLAESEPGPAVDYQHVQKGLKVMNASFSPAGERSKLQQQFHDLSQAHRQYVESTNRVLVLELYDKLIDRFYRRIEDPRFNATTGARQSQWPAYGDLKQENAIRLAQCQQEHLFATKHLEAIKYAARTKLLLARVEMMFDEKEQRHNARRAVSATPSQPRHRTVSADQVEIHHMRRKATIQRRQWSADFTRARGNLHHKRANLVNVHQFGNQGRVLLHESVVQALTTVQVGMQQSLFNISDVYPDTFETDDLRGDGGVILPNGVVNIAVRFQENA